MVYFCEVCNLLFSRSLPQTKCPFCEKDRVREAAEEEKEKFELEQAQELQSSVMKRKLLAK